jgi:hypothetical protein
MVMKWRKKMVPTKSILVIGDLEEDDQGEVIIRGHIMKEAINLLQVGPYQRAAGFSPAKTKKLMKVIEAGKIRQFPDVILGMRGHEWETVRTNSGGQGIALRDPVFIVDGLQRVWAWKRVTEENPTKIYSLGAKIYINTTQEKEAVMFRELNTGHTAMAPSVILRNEKEISRVAAMLFGLSHQEDFALCERVAWDQVLSHSQGGELIRGATLLHILRAIHSHKFQGDPGGRHSGGILANLASTDNQIDNIGLMEARQNLITFFNVVDEAWGIRNLTTNRSYPQLLWGWLNTLARVFSDHTDFWKNEDTRLYVPTYAIKNLKSKIDPGDKAIYDLAKGTISDREILYAQIVKRINQKGLNNRAEAAREKQRAEDAATEAQMGA